MTNMFMNNWQEVCLGEKIVSETIDLCKDDTKQQMSKELFLVVHRQIRLVGFKIMIILQINQNLSNLLQRAYSAVHLLCGWRGLHFSSGTTQSLEEKSWLHPDVDPDHLLQHRHCCRVCQKAIECKFYLFMGGCH